MDSFDRKLNEELDKKIRDVKNQEIIMEESSSILEKKLEERASHVDSEHRKLIEEAVQNVDNVDNVEKVGLTKEQQAEIDDLYN